MGILSTKEEKKIKVENELSESELETWRKSFEEYRVFQKKKIPTAFLGIPSLLWREIILPMVLSPKGSCDSCLFALGRKNYFSLRLVCWQFLSMVGGDDELWKKVVSRALGRDSLRAWGEVFWDSEKKFIKKRVLHSMGSAFYESNFDKIKASMFYSEAVYDTLIARKKAINKWLGEKSKWELIALFAVYRPVLTVKIEQGINLPADYVPMSCAGRKPKNLVYEEFANLPKDDYGNFPFTLHFVNTVPEKACKVSRGRIGKGYHFPEDDLFQQGCALNVLEKGFLSAPFGSRDSRKIPSADAYCQAGSSAYLDDLVNVMTIEKKVCDCCKCFTGVSFPVYCQLVVDDCGNRILHFQKWSLKLDKENAFFENAFFAMIEDRMRHEIYQRLVPERLRLADDWRTENNIRAFGFSSNVIKLEGLGSKEQLPGNSNLEFILVD